MTYDLIIVGGGPAGVSAGIYASRYGLNTLLITKEFGGQLAKKAVAIENYPGFPEISGLDLIKEFEKHLKKYKIETVKDTVRKLEKKDDKFKVMTEKNEFEAGAIIVATGADPRKLEVPGEEEFIGKGVSYCVACDGPLFRDKVVAIIGGGNTGFEAALFMSKIAKKVYILEYNLSPAADKINQDRAAGVPVVKVITNAALEKIEGEKFVNSLTYKDRATGKENNLKIDGVFVEIGTQPATSFAKGLVDFNEVDEIIIDSKTGKTSTPGLFAAGDADDVPYRQVVIAAGEGAKAALSVIKYLQDKSAYDSSV